MTTQETTVTPEPRTGPVASGCTWVNADLTFPKNFVEYATNVLAHKTGVAKELASKDTWANLMSGGRADADDRLQVYPICLKLLPTWKPGDPDRLRAKVHAKSPPTNFRKTSRWLPEQRAQFVLEDIWKGFVLNVEHAHKAWPFLVPTSALLEANGAGFTEGVLRDREFFRANHGYMPLVQADRYLSNEEYAAYCDWQRANKKGRWG